MNGYVKSGEIMDGVWHSVYVGLYKQMEKVSIFSVWLSGLG
jgi:hypothetical protein